MHQDQNRPVLYVVFKWYGFPLWAETNTKCNTFVFPEADFPITRTVCCWGRPPWPHLHIYERQFILVQYLVQSILHEITSDCSFFIIYLFFSDDPFSKNLGTLNFHRPRSREIIPEYVW